MSAEDTRISAEDCRWRCDADQLGFQTTAELKPVYSIMGQDEAVEALRFGLQNRFTGDNIFVRGLSGFGRMALIDQMISEIASGPVNSQDRCYVYNFEAPDQPRLLNLPLGRGREFKRLMDEFVDFVETDLPAFLTSDMLVSRQKELVAAMQEEIKALGEPFEAELGKAGLALVPVQVGQNMMPAILPVIDGKPMPFEEVQKRRMEGQISEDEFRALSEKISGFHSEMAELNEAATNIQFQHQDKIRHFIADEARQFVQHRLGRIRKRFALPQVQTYLDAIVEDLIDNRLLDGNAKPEFAKDYRVNLILCHSEEDPAPVVSIANPTMVNLVGKIDTEFAQNGMQARSDHMMIKPGALLEADGGYLIIEAREILLEPGAWSILLRTLKTGMFDMSSMEVPSFLPVPRLRPEPVPVDIKVILVGDPDTYFMLDQYEPRFPSLFKILADFGDTIARDDEGFRSYANMIARLVERDHLLPFENAAVAELIEHGARICAQKGRLTSQFGRIADISREASFIAGQAHQENVRAKDVQLSIQRNKRRADLPARRFRRMITEGALLIRVSGAEIGQINGLAVTSAGPLVYGIPMRITASIGPGSAGMINVERESSLSGSVHTKGFLIQGGLLRHLLRLDHPMAFSASIAFEQSYGGVDGDSASAAEFCCLISSLTQTPIRQDFAMTGAIDQKGNIMPIGAVTEKVEGYFDACQSVGFTGTQGVIIPRSNQGELMLRQDVVDAVSRGQFQIHAITRIEQALELFTGVEVGDVENPASGTLLAIARKKADDYWHTAARAK
ncbi:MAG: ATP-binding protein [Proteobacteria bacterium]|jgi:lon-related putative ATP-dependent protease|nr:ATP-binding protein [Pseudomonadota bacterium]